MTRTALLIDRGVLWNEIVPEADRDAFLGWMRTEGFGPDDVVAIQFRDHGVAHVTKHMRDDHGRLRSDGTGHRLVTVEFDHRWATPPPITPSLRSTWIPIPEEEA